MTNHCNTHSQLIEVRKYVDEHNLGKAGELVNHLLELEPNNILAMIEKITLWFTWGTPDMVSEERQRIHELAPGSAADLFAQVTTRPEGSPINAMELLDQALDINPLFERAWFAKGHILYEKKQYKQAIEALDRAIELAPRHSMALFHSGLAKHAIGDYWGAVMRLTDYIKTPDFCDRLQVFVTLADCFLKLAEQQVRKERERDTQLAEIEFDIEHGFEGLLSAENSTHTTSPIGKVVGVAKTPFHNLVCEMIDTLHTPIPFDIALLNASLKEATVIDVDDSIKRIVKTDQNVKTVSFGDLVDAAPPVGSDNLFIQFRSDSVHPGIEDRGWVGFHIVDFKIAKDSMILQKYKQVQDELVDFSHIYAVVGYEEIEGSLRVDQFGAILGVRENGGASQPGWFPIINDNPGVPGDAMLFLEYFFAMTYDVFSCFQLVNQCEAKLKYKDSIYWI